MPDSQNVENVVERDISIKEMYENASKEVAQLELSLREERLKTYVAQDEVRLYKQSLDILLTFLINFQR